MRFFLYCSALMALALGASMATAQTSPRPDPVLPAAQVPPAVYESAFTTYRRYEEVERQPWAEANDEARRLRGHRGQVETESAAPIPAAPAQPVLPPEAVHGHDH